MTRKIENPDSAVDSYDVIEYAILVIDRTV